MKSFTETLHSGQVLIFDGGMGSMLTVGGAATGAGLANLSHPKLVLDIHRAYLQAGADCLITNSLTLNSAYMKKAGQLPQLEGALNAAVEQALRAADGRAYVFGDMGPGGELLAPYGNGDPGAYYEAFCGQAAVFAEAALSGIIIETVFSLAEAKIMLAACHDAAPHLPVILSMTFAKVKDGGRTVMGDKAADIAATAQALGASAVGTNCGDLYPRELADVMRAMAPTGLPLIAQPNAGKPELSGFTVIYNLPPADFVADMLAVRQAGAQMLGGCCGTTPAHIEALAKELR
jgi:5-methyltetrahydrofolate--homocysteine methyltransferase